MSTYIHHVPGRIRVRSSVLRCPSQRAGQARERLESMAGIREVRLNPRAGSITVHYDPDCLKRSDLLATLEGLGCLSTTTRRADHGAHRIGELIGKALAGAVMKKALEQSARTLVGALL